MTTEELQFGTTVTCMGMGSQRFVVVGLNFDSAKGAPLVELAWWVGSQRKTMTCLASALSKFTEEGKS